MVVPAVTGLMTPVLLFMVAMAGVALVHTPPEVAFVREALCPIHNRVTPEFAPIGPEIVTVAT